MKIQLIFPTNSGLESRDSRFGQKLGLIIDTITCISLSNAPQTSSLTRSLGTVTWLSLLNAERRGHHPQRSDRAQSSQHPRPGTTLAPPAFPSSTCPTPKSAISFTGVRTESTTACQTVGSGFGSVSDSRPVSRPTSQIAPKNLCPPPQRQPGSRK